MLLVPLLILVSLGLIQGSYAACSSAPSVTKVSGTHAPNGELCAGDLLFEDTFDELDLKKWQHELTLGGGGVSRSLFFKVIYGGLSQSNATLKTGITYPGIPTKVGYIK